MNEEQFKKMDEAISHSLKRSPVRKVPAELLKNFSASVGEKIRERDNERVLARQRMPAFGLRVLVPVFAVFLLFFTVVFRGSSPLNATSPMLPFFSATTSEIADEVAALKAVGAWNEEDDKVIVADDSSLEETA